MNRISLIIVTAFLACITNNALACMSWASLTGYQIVDVNDLRKFDCPISGNYDCMTWPSSFYEWGYRCLELPGFYGYSEEGILMSNGDYLQMVVIDGIFNSPSCYTPEFYNCPSRY